MNQYEFMNKLMKIGLYVCVLVMFYCLLIIDKIIDIIYKKSHDIYTHFCFKNSIIKKHLNYCLKGFKVKWEQKLKHKKIRRTFIRETVAHFAWIKRIIKNKYTDHFIEIHSADVKKMLKEGKKTLNG